MTHPFYQSRQLHWLYGWHNTATGDLTGVGDYIRASRARGVPVSIYSTDSAGVVFEALESGSHPDDCIGFRFTSIPGVGDVDRLPEDTSGYTGDPEEQFDRLYDIHMEYFPPELRPYKDRIWYTCINEPQTYGPNDIYHLHNAQYLARGFLHIAKRVIADGGRYACAGWAAGNPHYDFWHEPLTLEHLRLAEQHPNQLGINWHLYSLDNSDLLANYGDHVGRYKYLYDLCQAEGIAPPFIVAGEAGWGESAMSAAPNVAIQQMAAVQEEAITNRFWGGFCLWTKGAWHGSIVRDMMKLDPLNTDMVMNYSPVTIPEIGGPTMPKIVIVKKPQKSEMTEAENEQVSKWAWDNYGRTTTHSTDDMMSMLAIGNDESYAVLWWAERQPDAEAALLDAGYNYIMMPDTPQPDWLVLNVPHMPQFGNEADARSNDCGAAAVAMIVNGQTNKRPSVDDIANQYQNPPNSYMNFTQLDYALNGYGMDGTHKRPYMAEAINEDIKALTPVIALVWYQSLPYRFSAFNGSHFIDIYATNDDGKFMYRDPLCPDSRELVITFAELEEAMRDAQNNGNQPNQGMVCKVKTVTPPPSGKTIDMLQYFTPASGSYGPITIKDTSWNGQVRQQIQAHGDYLYVTKGNEFEARQLLNNRIFFIVDDSPGDGKYYTVESADGWIPRYFTEGQEFTRKETARFHYKSNCNPTGEANAWTNVIKFVKFYQTWTAPGGLVFSDVSHLQWILNGVIEEDYYLAPHCGYALWKNKHGRQSRIVDMPQGQGNNVFNGACYWPAFGKEWP